MHQRRTEAKCFIFVLIAFFQNVSRGDFLYPDFESTIGLDFNGAAATSSCDEGKRLKYQPRHGTADQNNEVPPSTSEEDTQQAQFQTVRMDDTTQATSKVKDTTAILGHREKWGNSFYTGCRVRLRLTPSEPSKTGSVWHARPAAIFGGFQTTFTFQIVDPSRTCTLVKDRQFSTQHHESCMVHGADGFAFVLHGSEDKTSAIGDSGKSLGYGGIPNSVAFEFDTWWNPTNGDTFTDHVSIQSKGFLPNEPGEAGRLLLSEAVDLADGSEHNVKIVYFPFIHYEYVKYFTAISNVIPYLLDNEENRRIGTLVMWLDAIPANYTDFSAKPLLAMPINLSALLKLRDGTAYAGFTASTGRQFQKHDVIRWTFCENYRSCGYDISDAKDEPWDFDYHQESKKYSGTEYGKQFNANRWSAANQGSLEGVPSLPYNQH